MVISVAMCGASVEPLNRLSAPEAGEITRVGKAGREGRMWFV